MGGAIVSDRSVVMEVRDKIDVAAGFPTDGQVGHIPKRPFSWLTVFFFALVPIRFLNGDTAE